MSQTLALKIKGLWTSLNEFSEVPEGALALATNISLSKDSIAECRRGYASLITIPASGGGASQFADRLNEYGGDLIVHYASVLSYWDGSLHNFTGSYAHPSSTVTMKFSQQNKNFYFTTSLGVYKLDAITGQPVAAGVPAGLDISSATTGSTGFLAIQTSVAYRMVWGFKDANGNLLLGAPSQRAIVDNTSASLTKNTTVTFTIPQGITVNHFYQVYRSDQIAYTGGNPSTPDDNMQLVYEANPSSGDISAKSVTITDVTPDSLRGAALYTNETQEGILQQNTIPPACNDICSFKNCLFFACTSTAQNLNVTIIAVSGTSGIQANDTITIGANTFTAISTTPVAGSNNYQLYTSGSPAQNVNQTAINLVQTINQSSTNTTIYAYYLSGVNDLPGQLLIVNRNYPDAAFSATVSGHGSAWSPVLPTAGTTVTSSNTSNLNGLMYSKQQEPEAVPSQNIFYPGSANQPIYRILASRDSLFILKQDGVFRLSGTSPENFVIDTLDNTVFLTAPDTAAALNNCVYALTTQGVAQITDSGVSVVSRPIEDELNQIVGTVGLTNIAMYSFGVSYESERQYKLHIPQNSTDTSSTIAYVYNYFTKTWVTEARSQLCGYVLSTDNKLYMGNALYSNVVQERKDYEYTDYTDESFAVSIVSTNGTTINLSSAALVSVGDILYQSNAVASQVIGINIGLSTVEVEDNLTWAVGSTQLLKSIPCTIQWLPQTGQNPGMLKQFSEGLMIFRASPFISASISYLSDISASFEAVTLTGVSPLGWGLFGWGEILWGGVVRPQTIRHYIPREKQRCTLLTAQFFCQSGWSNFQLEGISLQYRTISSRTSR